MTKKGEEAGKEDAGEAGKETGGAKTKAPTLFEQYRRQGYHSYTVAERFNVTDLDMEARPYAIAEKVNLTQKKGGGIFVYLGFEGPEEEPLYMIVMQRSDLASSLTNAAKASTDKNYIGMELFSPSKRLGTIGLVALPRIAFLQFISDARSLK